MPTYQYACTNAQCGNEFELVQSFTDPSASECPACHGPVRKVFSAVGVVFKGSGFYHNDSRAANAKHAGSAGNGGTKSDAAAKSAGKSDSGASSSSSSSSDSSSSSAAASSSSSSGSAKSASSSPAPATT